MITCSEACKKFKIDFTTFKSFKLKGIRPGASKNFHDLGKQPLTVPQLSSNTPLYFYLFQVTLKVADLRN